MVDTAFYNNSWTLAAAVIALVSAVVAAWLSFKYTSKMSVYRAKLERAEAQLEHLYGPVNTIMTASEICWTTVWSKFCASATSGGEQQDMAALIFQEDGIVTKAERKAAYSLYLRKVFYPLAVQMVEIIEKNSHLLCESHLPKIVSKYVAHVYLHRAIIECYEVQKDGQQSNTAEGFTYLNKTDFEEKLPQIAFDPETVLYFSLRYNYLRYYRLFLLGHLKHDKETIKRAVEKINHLIKSEDRGDIVQPYEIVDVEAWKKKHEDEATKLRTLHDGIRPRDSRSRSSLHSSSSVFFQSFLRREQGTDPGQQLARRGSVENV